MNKILLILRQTCVRIILWLDKKERKRIEKARQEMRGN